MSSIAYQADIFGDGSSPAFKYAGIGVLGADIPTTGDNGGSPMLNDGIVGDHEYAWFLDTPPASGTIKLWPDGSFDYAPGADGAYTAVYRLYDDGADSGTGTITLTVGAGAASAPGATLSGSGTIAAGAASGGSGVVDATAPGATLSGSGSISPGTATGNQNATAPGATLGGAGSLSAGSAGRVVMPSARTGHIAKAFHQSRYVRRIAARQTTRR